MNFIPPQDETRLRAAASGILPNGKAVVVNADGTVSVISSSSATEALGSETVFDASSSNYLQTASAYDANSNRIVIVYADNGNSQYATAIVGTISGTSISFGTPVVIVSNYYGQSSIAYDSYSNKVVVSGSFYDGSADRGGVYVGTVNPANNSISFGSFGLIQNTACGATSTTIDTNSNKVVIVYADNVNSQYGTSVIGTISGTNISFGTPVVFESATVSGQVQGIPSTFDSSNNKVVIAFRDSGDGNRSKAIVGTVSGTSISFGSPVRLLSSNNTSAFSCVFDSTNNKVVIVFTDNTSNEIGQAIVGTVSGTNISFGTAVTFTASGSRADYISAVYNSAAQKVIISYRRYINSSAAMSAELISGTVSGTGISFGSATQFNNSQTDWISSAFDSSSNTVVTAYKDLGSSNKGTAIVYQAGFSSTNLTAENYVGMSGGVVDFDEGPAAFGSEVVFESAAINYTASAYDSNANKTVVVYSDTGNSAYGTAVVGTVNPSNNSISFGTPVVFEAASTSFFGISFDSNVNKFVIAYNDAGNSSYGTAIVGTISGTSISFGTPVVFQSVGTYFCRVVFDSNSNKIVLAYKQDGTGEKGTARVGTISGTDISFGTAVVFVDEKAMYLDATFDSNSNKVVVGFVTPNSSDAGAATVGTVSGTDISFGSKVIFNSGATNMVRCAFDSTNNKVVFAYRDDGSSYVGTAIVGTVSGTSISFGTPSVFQASQANVEAVVYDPVVKKVFITYRDQTTSANGTIIPGIVSGTSISFETKAVFNAGSTMYASASYDSGSNKVVINYRDETNSAYGASIVYQPAFNNTARGQVASGSSASVDIIGTVSTNQDGLTPGQSYFVQTNGTLALTAGSPSVFAGTAISATKLLVKT